MCVLTAYQRFYQAQTTHHLTIEKQLLQKTRGLNDSTADFTVGVMSNAGTDYTYQLQGVPRQFLKVGEVLCARCIQGTFRRLSWLKEPSRILAGD